MAACAALLVTGALASAQQPNTNDQTYVTFSAPVSLPGVTLPAGSYMFQLLNSQANRNVVQVFDHDRTKLYATLLAMPASRPEPADATVITFREAPVNAPPAVQFWYYPGRTDGQEFAYPKSQAIKIANAAHTSVLSVDVPEGSDMSKGGNMSRVEPGAAMDTASNDQQGSSATEQARSGMTPQSSQPQTATDSTNSQAGMSASSSSTAPSSTGAASSTAMSSTAPSSTGSASSSTAPSTTSSQSTAVGTSGSASPSAVGSSGSAAAATPQSPSSTAPSSTAQSATAPSSTASNSASGDTSAAAPARSGRLPKTGSELPLVGVAGLLALAAALGVRTVRRATV